MNVVWTAKAALLTMMFTPTSGHSQQAAAKLNALADHFVDQQLQYNPTLASSTGLPTRDHSRFSDRRPKAFLVHDREERKDLKALLALPIESLARSDRATYANLRERMESDLQLRVCRTELWNVNHFDGWQSEFAEVAERQPVDSAEERKQALKRWRSMPKYLDVEIANLRLGLSLGYSAPQTVVRRVILQMDALAIATPAQSIFYSPGRRSGDAAFKKAFRQLVLNRIAPALKSYRDFLQMEYLPKARQGVAISDLPNGAACYQAFLRSSTTLERTPQEIYDLGQKTVRENIAEIAEIGNAQYGSRDLSTIVAKIRSSPAEHFQSKDDLLAFSQQFLRRAKQVTAGQLVTRLPQQDVIIQTLSPLEEDAGVGSRFQGQPDPGKAAVFLIKLEDWSTETRSDAEIVTAHETVPGHYLQKALARELQPPTRLSMLIDNDAYAEGWARYAEAIGEEAKIYDTEDAAVMRRLWPARGMVVDPGLHAFHWTRQAAVDYMVSSGHLSADEANDYVDRMAVMPGQLASYDTGALEIKGLRAEAQAKLGTQFDQRRFNRAVLEEGVVPLGELHAHLQAWMADEVSCK